MELTKYALFDLAQWKNGLAFKKIDFSPTGKPVIKIAELKNGITGQTQFTEADYGEDVHLTKGDMLFSWSGNPETSIDVFWYNLPDGWLNQHIFKITPKSFVDKYFLYYLLKYLKPIFKSIASNKQTTGLGHITIKDLKELIVFLPNIKIQKDITTILRSLDEKIQLNNKVNDNLEQQATSLFKAWFIDFIPFGKTLPSKWQKTSLGKIAKIGAGGDKPQKVSSCKTKDTPFPIYSNGITDEGLYGFTNHAKIIEESVTVSARGTIGFVCLRHTPYLPIVRLITLVPDTNFISAKYLYLYLKQLNILGTGTTQQQLTVPNFRKTEVLLPTKKLMDTFTDIITPLFETIWINQAENNTLASLRDTLLPKLMSGEIDVSDIAL